MNKLLIFVLFLASFFFGNFPVWADTKKAYDDYQFQYSQYRKSFSDFTVANASYKTYQTLTSQNAALEKMRTALINRNQLVSSYLVLVGEKLSASETMSQVDIDTYNRIFVEERQWLSNHQKKLSVAGTVPDLNIVSSEFDQRYIQISNEYQKAIGVMFISRTDAAQAKVDDFFTRTTEQLDRMDQLSEDTSGLRRGVDLAKTKVGQYAAKRDEANKIIYPDERSNYLRRQINLVDIQKYLDEATAYTKEGVRYLKEVLFSITK